MLFRSAERRADIPAARLAALRAGFAAGRCSDEETIETIRRVHQRTGELLDPHGAVAVHVAGIARGRRDVPKIVDWYMDGKIDIDSLITHTMPVEKINDAFDLMHRGESIRSVVTF